MYAIVDVETTGLAADRSKITDIAIFIHDGEKIVDSYSTLINPECTIPPRISMLTGITDEMVADAPKFYEVARDIFIKTENMIFVAHNVRSLEATLPPNLPREVFEAIPEETGVYYFRDETEKIIYIGKASNIKIRLLSHFSGGEKKPLAMLSRTHDITYSLTGSELVALLLESDEIKKHYPLYNRSQKRFNDVFGICKYEDKLGYKHFGYVDKEIQIERFEQAQEYIKPYKDNKDIQRILRSYLRKSSGKGIIEK